MQVPPVSLVRALDTHRLIPSKHLPQGDSVLADIADDTAHLQAIFELDAATNDRLLAGQQLLPGIGLEELVFAVPHAAVINAAFCHPHPLGSRFNGPDRGAWYAALDLRTARAEVGFHRTIALAEIGRFEDTVTYDDYLADFSASFHDLRAQASSREPGDAPDAARACLDPASYVASQTLAESLLAAGSLGVIYPSVRREGGTCLACFRPAVVNNVRRNRTYRFTWSGTPRPTIYPLS
jgi:RES domain-containing protein